MADIPDIKARKSELRAEAQHRRAAVADKDGQSRQICERIIALPEFDTSRIVMLYIDTASEVRTQTLIDAAMAQGKTLVVPYCVGDDLRLFHLESIDELAPGAYDIMEPRPSLRKLPQKCVTPGTLDLVVVPGVAFDRTGRRLGHGKGYYDRLLTQVGRETFLVAPAFECQVFDRVPTLPHDVPVHRVVTQSKVYPS